MGIYFSDASFSAGGKFCLVLMCAYVAEESTRLPGAFSTPEASARAAATALLLIQQRS